MVTPLDTGPGPPFDDGQAPEQELFDRARVNQLSHDLRTPLTVIVGYAELLQTANPREDQRQGIDAVLAAGACLGAVVEHLLEQAGAQHEIAPPTSVITAMYPGPPDSHAPANGHVAPTADAPPNTDAPADGDARLRGRRRSARGATRGHTSEPTDPRERLARALHIPSSALSSLDREHTETALARVDTMAEELRTAQAPGGMP